MKVSVGFKDTRVCAPLDPVYDQETTGSKRLTIDMTIVKALATLSQAIEDEVVALDELDDFALVNSELSEAQVAEVNEKGVRLIYTDSSPGFAESWRLDVLSREENRYLLAIPNPTWTGGVVVIVADVSDTLRGWTIHHVALAGRPIY